MRRRKPSEEDLWADWHREQSRDARNALVVHYQWLVDHLVSQRNLPATQEEYWSHGQIGLMEAIEKYDPAKGVPFVKFASPRIKWAMASGAREFDPVPRRVREAATRVNAETERLRQTNKAEPTAQELAAAAGGGAGDSWAIGLMSSAPLDGTDPADTATPEIAVDDYTSIHDVRDRVAAAIERLTGVDAVVFAMHYLDGTRIVEIAEHLGVSFQMAYRIRDRANKQVRAGIV